MKCISDNKESEDATDAFFFRLSWPRSRALANHLRNSPSISFWVALVVNAFLLTAPKHKQKEL